MKGKVGLFVLLCLISILTGCNAPVDDGLSKAKAGYITGIYDKSILVNDTYFSTDKNLEVVSDAGAKLKFADLEIGVKVEPWFTGGVRESFPAQADAKKIVVLTDKESEKIQPAVKAVVEYAEVNYGKTVVFQEIQETKEYFQVTIAGITIENPNPSTLRYNYATKEIEVI